MQESGRAGSAAGGGRGLGRRVMDKSHRAQFISEDDLETFEGWLRYQAVDAQQRSRRTSWPSGVPWSSSRYCSAPPPHWRSTRASSVSGAVSFSMILRGENSRVGLCPCEVSSFFKAREKTLFA